MNNVKQSFSPIISSIQKIALYETKTKFYLIGSNNTQTRFRVLEIDRMQPRELLVIDDKIEYSQEKIRDLVTKINFDNRTRSQKVNSGSKPKVTSAFGIVGSNTGEESLDEMESPSASTSSKISFWRSLWKFNTFPQVVPAFGLLGFIKFLEGYYIILVTKRRIVAVIGYHTIYKIEDTSMIYIPNDGIRISHPDESRYVKMFQNIDLSSNFYFSYSYDLTHTLQYNMTMPCNILPELSELFESTGDGADQFQSRTFDKGLKRNISDYPVTTKAVNYGIRNQPNKRFVWNMHLLNNFEQHVHPDWILYVTHGFIGQSDVSIFGRSVYVTLIARRSCKYAGTRFLKRGGNFEGDVANEVETEQIVYDSGISSFERGNFTSFVQMRGSIPAHWSQDISKMVPKPPIVIDLSDPFAEVAGNHFSDLLRRYGSPIIILNLAKKREKKKHESILSEEFSQAVRYLNLFLPPDQQIQYISFDMARMNKGKTANVMGRLAKIAYNTVCQTGVFHNSQPYYNQNLQSVIGYPISNGQHVQTGIIRVNCVDCLDRTNTAQFAIGKCALGFQLCALGVLKDPILEFDSDCVRMLEELYEDHGDTLALQYGGSQLVHRIKTYRKTAPWTSQGNDIMQTLSRYYSNTFSDAEKQHTINLFLGLFIPEENRPPIWELTTDYYLHHPRSVNFCRPSKFPLTKWWDTEVLGCLPRSYDEVNKLCSDMMKLSRKSELVDGYVDYHRPYEFTVLSIMFAYKISHSVRDFMPHFTTDFSPFSVRVRPGRRREETASKGSSMKNPSLTGESSTSSTTSSASSSPESDDSDEEEQNTESQQTASKDSISGNITFEVLFPSMRQIYGVEIGSPKKTDLEVYKRYVQIWKNATKPVQPPQVKSIRLNVQSSFKPDSSANVVSPQVNEHSLKIYQQYTNRGIFGATQPSNADLSKYQSFVNNGVLEQVLSQEILYKKFNSSKMSL